MAECINCRREITNSHEQVAWTPPDADESVYAIVSSHLACMRVGQLRQAIASEKRHSSTPLHAHTTYTPYTSHVIRLVRRLSELLAGAETGGVKSLDIDTLNALLATGSPESISVAVDMALEKQMVPLLGKHVARLAADNRAYRDSLRREISYEHWSDEQRQVLQLALKWFDERLG